MSEPPRTKGQKSLTAAPEPIKPLAIHPVIASPRPPADGNDITPEEYALWFTPAELVAAAPRGWSWDTCTQTIASSLKDGLVRSVADVIVMDNRPPAQMFELPKVIWGTWGFGVDTDFWSAGLRKVYRDQRGYHGVGFTAYRVRLDPEGCLRMIPGLAPKGSALSPAPQAPSRPSKAMGTAALAPKVDRNELREWVRGFAQRNPGSPFKVILHNAKMRFEPQFRVTELPTKGVIADLGLTLSQGNPTILQK